MGCDSQMLESTLEERERSVLAWKQMRKQDI